MKKTTWVIALALGLAFGGLAPSAASAEDTPPVSARGAQELTVTGTVEAERDAGGAIQGLRIAATEGSYSVESTREGRALRDHLGKQVRVSGTVKKMADGSRRIRVTEFTEIEG